ncbi:MAG: hypothetical protein R2867_06615 [Caldilineaceae bacterium]
MPSGTNGELTLAFAAVPVDGDTSQLLGARFRLSTDTGLTADGSAGDGEVLEDYRSLQPVIELGNYVWQDYDLDNAGQ